MAISRNLGLRIGSALVLAPIVIGAIIAGGWYFGTLIAFAFALSCAEWFEITARTERTRFYFWSGLFFIIASFSIFAMLRMDHANGLYLTIVMLLCVWASDTGAYIFGRAIGGPKLAPTISPNKTWAGLVGSMLGSSIAFVAMMLCAPSLSDLVPHTIIPHNSMIPFYIIYGVVIGVVGQSGDLLESLMKRKAGMKDSGTLIPGHGGILDRIDALLMIIPVFSVIAHYGL